MRAANDRSNDTQMIDRAETRRSPCQGQGRCHPCHHHNQQLPGDAHNTTTREYTNTMATSTAAVQSDPWGSIIIAGTLTLTVMPWAQQ
jgi:hypothetical protein